MSIYLEVTEGGWVNELRGEAGCVKEEGARGDGIEREWRVSRIAARAALDPAIE